MIAFVEQNPARRMERREARLREIVAELLDARFVGDGRLSPAQPSRERNLRTTPVCAYSCHERPRASHHARTRRSRAYVIAFPVSS
jgi:hypothetical protein